MPNSSSNISIHTSSVVALATALYSASADDLATTFYFLLFHITRLPPSVMQYPNVDLLSDNDLAQSTSTNPWISIAAHNLCLV